MGEDRCKRGLGLFVLQEMKGAQKSKGGNQEQLGRTLQKASRKKKTHVKREAQTQKEHHALQKMPAMEDQSKQLKSQTEPSNLVDFIATAELKNDNFNSQKQNTVVIETNAFVQVRHDPTEEQLKEQKQLW